MTNACRLLLAVVISLLTSCSYRMGGGDAPWLGSTIAVPYVGCDPTGEVTMALVREIASSGSFEYTECSGCYTLAVSIVDRGEESIGFRYEYDKNGTRTNTIIPVESRGRYVAEFSLIETCSGRTVLGPERVSASVEYDHEYNGGSDELNSFSLGQVTDVEAARDAVPQRVGKVLAERIVDYLQSAW